MVLSVWSSAVGGKQKVKPSAEQLLREHVKPEWTDKGMKVQRIAIAVFSGDLCMPMVTTCSLSILDHLSSSRKVSDGLA